jgi:ABC-type multidrug transport system permease subunit
VAIVSAAPELERALLASKRLRSERLPRDEALRALARTKLDLVVDGRGGTPDLHYDAAQERGQLARALVADELERAAGRRDTLTISETAVSELGSRYVDFLIPGLIGLNLMGSSMWGIGYNLVLARKRRLLRRYAVTPMRRSHFLFAHFVARSVFLALELALLVLFGRLVFGTVIQGNVLGLLLTAIVGAASFASISLLIGARLDNTEVANGWMNFVMLPMWILSGSFFSYERFPDWLHLPIQLLPLTALNDALRAIYNDGAGLTDCTFQLGVLLVWGALGFVVALRTFRWQ